MAIVSVRHFSPIHGSNELQFIACMNIRIGPSRICCHFNIQNLLYQNGLTTLIISASYNALHLYTLGNSPTAPGYFMTRVWEHNH